MAVNMYNVNMTKHRDREDVIEENIHITNAPGWLAWSRNAQLAQNLRI